MPTYQYACTACEHRFEAVQSFSDASLSECPVCAGKLRKVFSSVGIVFKGSGFYRTDSRGGAVGANDAGGKESGKESSGESGKDSGKESTKESGKSTSDSSTSSGSSSGSKDSGSSTSTSGAGKATASSGSSTAAAS